MKNILKIYFADMRRLMTNWAALLIIGGLIILPPLYAWVNIEASWDPYSNTAGIKVAVVNEDKGAMFNDKYINLGGDTAAALKENKSLGWKFYADKDEAMDDLVNGKVYAYIYIPGDFSYNLTTIFEKVHVKPQIEYYENEKINAIAPKITTAGATAVQQQINTNISKEMSKIIFSYMGELGIELDENGPKLKSYSDLVFKLDALSPEISKAVGDLVDSEGKIKGFNNRVIDNIPTVTAILDHSLRLNKDLGAILDATKNNVFNLDKSVGTKINTILTRINDCMIKIDETGKIVTDKSFNVIQSIENIRAEIAGASNTLSGLDNFIDKLSVPDSGGVGEVSKQLTGSLIQLLGDANSRLEDLKDAVSRGELDKVRELAAALAGICQQLSDMSSSLTDNLNSKLPAIKSFSDNLARLNITVSTTLDEIKQRNEKAMADMLSVLTSADGFFSGIANTDIPFISELSRKLLADITDIETNISSLKQLSGSADYLGLAAGLNESITAFQTDISQLCSILQNMSAVSADIARSIGSLTRDLDNKAQRTNEDIVKIIERAQMNNTLIQNSLGDYLNVIQIVGNIDLSHTLKDSQSRVQSVLSVLADYYNRLDKLKAAIQKSSGDAQNLIAEINAFNVSLSSKLTQLKNDYTYTVSPYLKTNVDRLVAINGDISSLLYDTRDGINDLRELLQTARADTDNLIPYADELNSKLPDIQGSIHKLAGLLKEYETRYDLDTLISTLNQASGLDDETMARFVDLKKNSVFAMPNYGSAMLPFFTTLSLWVGALFLVSLLTVKVDGEYKTYQKFIGKYLFYCTIAVLQALIVTLGDIFMLRAYIVDPAVFVLTGVLQGIVFSMMVYTLVSIFDNVGKAIGVVFLVLQISASGGTFPIEVTSEFFKAINPFLPFTYAIGAMREACGGIVWGNFLSDISILACYFAVFCFIGLKLKEPINKLGAGFNKKFKESKLSEH